MLTSRARKFWRSLTILIIIGGVGWWLWLPESVAPEPEDLERLVEVFGGQADFGPPPYEDFDLSSHYVTMDDGVQLAVDVLLPASLKQGETVPAIILPTRYWRRWELYFPFSRLFHGKLFDRMFTSYGYALVYVDVRGSGASFGTRLYPWSSRELSDLYQVMDWVEGSDWCDGSLGVCGTSYGGTCAEFMTAMGHPALKASVIRYSLYDVYEDIAFPGGMFNYWFVSNWQRFNGSLDANAIPEELPWYLSGMVRGVAPVETDDGQERINLVRALMDHSRNGDILEAAASVTFRDDIAASAGVAVDSFSPHKFWQEAGQSDVPMYVWGGWFDGAYAHSALERIRAVGNPQRVVIGPWNHGGGEHASPYLDDDAETDPSLKVQYLEQLRFFDHYLKGKGEQPANECIYYTFGSETWASSSIWPPEPPQEAVFRLGPQGTLELQPVQTGSAPEEEVALVGTDPDPQDTQGVEADTYEVDWSVGSGEMNRWRTQLGRTDVIYADRAEQDARLLVYDSEPQERETLILGSPALILHVASTDQDGAVFAYLEDVSPSGKVRYLSEGLLRLVHGMDDQGLPSFLRDQGRPMEPGTIAALRIEFLPVAVQIPAGHRIRLAIAGADSDQFQRVPAEGTPTLTIHRSSEHASELILPVQISEEGIEEAQ